MNGLLPAPYAPLAERIFASMRQGAPVTQASDVAEVGWQVVNDTSDRLRFPAGPDAVATARAQLT
jgi:hypothetical protein